MKICPNCQTANREGVFFCDECGQSLIGVNSIATKQFNKDKDTDGLGALSGAAAVASWGTARLSPKASVIIHVRDSEDPMTLQPTPDQQMIMGRSDPASGNRPDIDLTPFGAQDKGVSRVHASLRRTDDTLTLTDLGSVNGTYLNGQRLVSNQARVLRDGDEIRLGKMVMHVYYK
jgi:hypothetical protein